MSEQAPDKPVILVVDDSKVIRRAAAKMLGDAYTVLQAVDGVDAWAQIQQDETISVVFTDMQMPEMNGLELIDHIRGSDDDHIMNLPVIIITGQDDSEAAKKEVFGRGATDFISKPFDSIDLLSRAQSYARLTRKVVELEKQSGTDKLTGLANVSSFKEQGDKALSFAQRHKLNISVVHLEIEDFQGLYLSHGKAVAQQIIVAVGKRLGEALRAEDISARTGVAKYALLLPITKSPTAHVVIERIREIVNKLVFNTGKEKIRVGIIAGLTSPNVNDDMTFDTLLEQADAALDIVQSDPEQKVASYMEEAAAVEDVISDEDMRVAFERMLEGNYYQIPESHLAVVADKVRPFLDYVESQDTQQLTGTDPSA